MELVGSREWIVRSMAWTVGRYVGSSVSSRSHRVGLSERLDPYEAVVSLPVGDTPYRVCFTGTRVRVARVPPSCYSTPPDPVGFGRGKESRADKYEHDGDRRALPRGPVSHRACRPPL